MKGPSEKNYDGIYSNARFIHTAASLVGCIVQLQVKSGAVYEGVFRTFSQKFDIVLEMAHKVEGKKTTAFGVGPVVSTMLASIINPDEITDKLIFKVEDVIMITASNVDPEYATRETFTDTAISKFNGQVLERELEPWDGGTLTVDGLGGLGADGEESNGWDPNDMFRTNEEKYGVKSSFDSTLHGYTIPLEKKNTEEYKQQEAKACKIAQEIESGFYHKSRLALENGDEEEKFSAVVRPDNSINSRYVPPRRRNTQGARTVRSSPSPSTHHGNRNSHPHSQTYHRVSSPATTNTTSSQTGYKTASSTSSPSCVSTPSPRPTPSSTPTPRQPTAAQQTQSPLQQQPPPQFQQPQTVNTVQAVSPLPVVQSSQDIEERKVNGVPEGVDRTEQKFEPKPLVTQPSRVSGQQISTNKESVNVVTVQPSSSAKSSDRRKDGDKKTLGQKARDDKTEDLKRFHAKFKLSEDKEGKEHKEELHKSEIQPSSQGGNTIVSKQISKEKEKSKDEERNKCEQIEEAEISDSVKVSTLNPNAKEFVLNPNAKAFTPRALPVASPVAPPPVQPPPRLHTQSPVMAVPQPHLVPGMAQPMFTNMTPHYVVSATPVSVTPPFPPAVSMAQAPRFRKAMPLTLQPRHDISQSVHVAAATGQPILAPAALSTPQFAIQYTPSPGMMHPQGPPQPAMTYTQMYSVVGPRVIAPQPVGMVPTSYGETTHVPTHLYMSPHPGTASIPHALPQGNTGQHSNSSTPQSQTPSLHPAPSPVHQPPPSGPHGNHGQPPTPTGHPGNAPTPQPVIYHGHISQHPLHANPASSANQAHHYQATFTGGPQPIMLLPQQVSGPHNPHPASFSSLQNHHLHGQTPGSHAGTPTHVLPHPPLAMIPTSAAAMVHAQNAMSGGHFVPHTQEDSDENEKDRFYSQPQDIFNSVKKGDVSLVLGDFNAKVDTDSDLWAGVLGPFGIGSSNGNGERLLQVCSGQF